jgi:hypothetical protein
VKTQEVRGPHWTGTKRCLKLRRVDVQFGESRDDANADAEPAAHSDHAKIWKRATPLAPAGALAALMFSGNVLTCVGQLMEPPPVQQSLVLQQKVMQLFRITMQIVLPRPVLVLNKVGIKNIYVFFAVSRTAILLLREPNR